MESEPFIDFETIFNKEQQESIERKFSKLNSVKLKKSKLINPEAITRKRGSVKISFPIFQKGKDGNLYAFLF